ncbi:MAG: hypothetical protein ACI4TH_03750 [Candidatus Ornithomonoglobus sp.]
MALKDKKNRGNIPADMQNEPEDSTACGTEEPFKVFNTKEEFDAEIARIANQQQGGGMTGTITPYYDASGGMSAAYAADNGYAADSAYAAGSGIAPQQRHGGQITSDGIVRQWQSDAQKLAVVVPDFDFQAALRNDTFRNALTSGRNIFEAYAEMVRVPGSAGRAGITQNAQYARRGTGEATVNPSKLSSEDFKKYIESRKNA